MALWINSKFISLFFLMGLALFVFQNCGKVRGLSNDGAETGVPYEGLRVPGAPGHPNQARLPAPADLVLNPVRRCFAESSISSVFGVVFGLDQTTHWDAIQLQYFDEGGRLHSIVLNWQNHSNPIVINIPARNQAQILILNLINEGRIEVISLDTVQKKTFREYLICR